MNDPLHRHSTSSFAQPAESRFDAGEESIIPGLPDDLALKCLAKISHGYHGTLQAVCKRWWSLLQSSEYGRVQTSEGHCGDWIFVRTEEPSDGHWVAYDPAAKAWHPLPPIPRLNSNLHCGFGTAVVANKLLIIGGYYGSIETQPSSYFATNEVLQFDPFYKKWSKAASMQTARCNFACAVVGGKVYVAGGCRSSRRSPLVHAEVYDPLKDRWEEIAPLPGAREDCVGISLRGYFYVIAGAIEEESDPRAFEVYDPERARWFSLPDVWLYPRHMPCPIASTSQYICAVDDWDGNRIKLYDPLDRVWRVLAPGVPTLDANGEESSRVKAFAFGVITLRNDLYILGGKFMKWERASGQWRKFDIVKLNTVFVGSFSTRSHDVTWTKATPMWNSYGEVIGCAVLEDNSVNPRALNS